MSLLGDLTLLANAIDLDEDLLYLARDTGSSYADRKITPQLLFGALGGFVPGGRLTLETGVPVSSTDQTARQVVYYTPYTHNRIWLFDGTNWKLFAFAELSLTLSGLTSGKNYDVFCYDNAGTLTLELGAAWTDDTTRSAALTTQDGVLVKSGSTTRRYLGTIRASSSTTTEDIGGLTTSQVNAKRYVWNMYNRVARPVATFDATNSYSSSVGTTLPHASWKVEVLIGYGVQSVPVQLIGVGSALSTTEYFAFGKDSDSSAASNSARCAPTTAMQLLHDQAVFGLGYHYVSILFVSAAASGTIGGDLNAPTASQTRLDGAHWC